MPDQSLLSVVEIPYVEFYDYPVDIYIRIYRNGARYDIEFQAVGQTIRTSIEMSPEDLVELNKQLQRAMLTVAKYSIQQREPKRDEFDAQLRSLAEVGNYAFRKVFGCQDAMTTIEELLALGEHISIEIASEDFFLPWEVLYPNSLAQPISYNHFWGMNHIISRIIVQNSHSGAFVSPIIAHAGKPSVGLVTYDKLLSVAKEEIPFFETLADRGELSLSILRALEPKKRLQELNVYKSFLNNHFDIAHFACHAKYESTAPNSSHLKLTDNFKITLMDMEVYDIIVKGHPLVILNACQTGNLNPLYTSYFARAFLKQGARGVVATECSVPDAFGADFSKELYKHLLTGKPLGESLLATRRHFATSENKLSGLLYSMYASPAIRLRK